MLKLVGNILMKELIFVVISLKLTNAVKDLTNDLNLVVISLNQRLWVTALNRVGMSLVIKSNDKPVIDTLTPPNIFVIAPVNENVSDAIFVYNWAVTALAISDRLKDKNIFAVSNKLLMDDNENDRDCKGVLINDSNFVGKEIICKLCDTPLKNIGNLPDIDCRLIKADKDL
jgi:acetylglutamate kinase